jgi:hypothetical protein
MAVRREPLRGGLKKPSKNPSSRRKPGSIVEQRDVVEWIPASAGMTLNKEAGRYFVVIATSAATTRSSKAVPLMDCFAVGLQ